MDWNMMFDKFAKGLMLAVLAGYVVALLASIAIGDYKNALGLAIKGTLLVGLNLIRMWVS